MAKKRSSSKSWLKEHRDDPYVQRAQREGYRHRGRVIASDILAMDSLAGVEFIQGDFTEEAVFEQILVAIGDSPVDLVISDMAPNMSGMNAVDQPRSMYLVELALDMARRVLAPGGSFVAKVFQGEGFDELIRDAREGVSGGVREPHLKHGDLAPTVVNWTDTFPA